MTAHHGRNSGENVFALSPDAPSMPFIASAGKSSTSAEQTLALGAPAMTQVARAGKNGKANSNQTFVVDDAPAHTIKRQMRRADPESTMALAFHCTQDPISAEERTPLISAESTGAIGVLPVFIASDGSSTESDCAPTIGTDANRPARTMTIALDYQQGGEGAGVVREEVAPTMGVRADRAAVFAFDETQITSAENRSTVSPGGPVPTVSATSRLRVASDLLVPRRLTPREVERCFGFPDDYTLIPGAADSPRYEALGNSMAVPVMRWIGRRLLMVDGIVRGR